MYIFTTLARSILAVFFCLSLPCFAQVEPNQEGPYPVDPASIRHTDVPRGTIVKHKFNNSSVFPGTEREYAVYVPAQYDASKPACLMVVQDGLRFMDENSDSKVPIVFDNLIHGGEMPVTIGVFINPGVVPAQNKNALPRFNRSLEYDAVDDRYVNFLLSELLPEVEKNYQISPDPNDRGICGSSSGGIAAFNVAWQRPDQFRRIYTVVGTYIGLRGGNELSVLVRKTAPKPLRVFLQDGSNDLNIYCGDWWMANQDMLSALEFSGYEVDHVWGAGFHGQKHGGAIFPDAMRFVWKDWPQPVTTHFENSRSRAPEMLLPDEDWELVSEGHGFTEGPVVDENGTLYFSDLNRGQVIRITNDGEKSVVWDIKRLGITRNFAKPDDAPLVNGLAIGPDGSLYGCLPARNAVVKFRNDGSDDFEVMATDVQANDIVVAHDGTIYFTEPRTKSVWMIQPNETAKIAGDGFSGVNGIVLSPDQSLVYVSDFAGRYVWSSVRLADGALTYSQPYFHIHAPPASVDLRTQSDGMCVDRDGWVLVATKMGIQICDQPGRVNLIVPLPTNARHPANVCFGGKDRKTIFATCGGKVFKLKTKLTGTVPWTEPVTPATPRL